MARFKQGIERLLPTPVVKAGSKLLDRSIPSRRRIRAQIAEKQRQREIVQALYVHYDQTVQGGPFAGLILPKQRARDDSAAYIVGSYEAELHDVVETVLARQPTRVVNVGAAAGYYAVGFAKRAPAAEVWAFDTDPVSQELVLETAALNGVSERVHVGGLCTPLDLQDLITSGTVLVIDCEGGEDDLLNPEIAPALRSATMLVELHDFIEPRITRRVLDRFAGTHRATILKACPRDTTQYPALGALQRRDWARAVNEFRPSKPHPMRWALLEPQ